MEHGAPRMSLVPRVLLRVGALLVCVCASFAPRVSAHPLPNTVIAVSINGDGVSFDVAVPVPELRLALPGSIPKTADLLTEPQRSAVIAYFKAHCSVQSKRDAVQPVVVQSITMWEARDENVGLYQELRARILVAARPDFDPRDFTLRYDAIIHQVPNHFARVQIVRDFRGGVLGGDGVADVGVIAFDFARNETPALAITAAPASLWKGVSAAVALGFHHVVTWFDHVLLVIVPLSLYLYARGARSPQCRARTGLS
jgi:hypothetical protein